MIARTRPRPVFSIWAWLVLAPYLLVALGGMDGAANATQWLLGAGVAIVVHAALLLVFLALGALELLVAARPAIRWTLVVVALVAIGFARPTLLSALQSAVGLDLVTTTEWIRVLLNALVISAGTLLVHGLRESFAHSRASRRRLLAVLERIRAQTERVETTADAIAEEFQRDVRAPVLDALGGLVGRNLPPHELSDELRFVAHAVVRPLSHRAADAGLENALGGIEIDGSPATGVQPVSAGPRLRITTPPAWLVTIVIITILFPAEINSNGWGLAPPLSLAAAAVSLVGGLLLHLVRWPAEPRIGLTALVGAELVVGAMTTATLLGPLWGTPIAAYYLTIGILGYAVVATSIGVIWSRRRELADHQQQTAMAVAEAERRAFEARQRLALESRAMGRMLHTEVQGDLVATSLQLRLGTAGPEPLDRLIDRVDRLLSDPVAAYGDDSASASAIRDGFRASLDAWALSLDLDVDVEAAAIERLAERPRSASVAHDALTEGLTNAVRHGRGDRAAVAIRVARDTDDAVEVTVASPGRIAGGGSAGGMGLRDLDARAQAVSLAQVDGDVVLRVLV